ncbi:ABC transporter ATP-binding protein [Neokomagataea thailandica]|uniref:Spermidine/putrescine ABC transporter ATP-binding protein n=1 Tax=Neokomagataea tanensis NBRC 106556 TaxID=1223519 RepID=A0ABQ0QHZ4_9PROT|nr:MULTISPECIES: ATP-binding cassette domain-containing protein [Neokomagataea]GBR45490.1 spermidine/putrescine ABC transporter ATP-binding protein [Neokomagataea tanensis NBRC 106556]
MVARLQNTHKPAPSALFKVENLRIGLQDKACDLELIKGETLVLLGTDMAALALLLDIIAGFQPCIGGRLTLNGVDITPCPAGKRRIALVSERDPLFPHLTVRANINFACRAQQQDKGTAAANTAHLISLLGLDDVATLLPKMLSTEKQLRTKLARALAYKGDVLLLDDPLSSLTVPAARRVEALLTRLQRALGLSIIRSEGRQEIALRSDGIIALFNGRTLLQSAPASILYERPISAYVATLFGNANALTGQITDEYDDIYTVHLACGGVVEASSSLHEHAHKLHIGDTCMVCVRPDRISPFFGKNLISSDDELPPVQGTLIETLHLGDHIRMKVRCADGTDIEIHRPPIQAQKIPKNGTQTTIAWPAAQATVFPLEVDLY